LETKIIHIF